MRALSQRRAALSRRQLCFFAPGRAPRYVTPLLAARVKAWLRSEGAQSGSFVPQANLTTGNLDLIRPEETRALQINPAHFVDGPPPEVVAVSHGTE